MPTQTVTLQMPGPLYDQLMCRAVETQRSFEEETLEVLTAVLPGRVSEAWTMYLGKRRLTVAIGST